MHRKELIRKIKTKLPKITWWVDVGKLRQTIGLTRVKF